MYIALTNNFCLLACSLVCLLASFLHHHNSYLPLFECRMATSQHKVVMVTGGSGLVGYALKKVVSTEAKNDESWIFLSSTDGDLT